MHQYCDHMGQDAEQQDEKPKVKAPWWYYAIAIGLLAACVIGVSRANDHKASPEETKADAQRACEDTFIPDRLKSPATAKFSGVTTVYDGSRYTVTGRVDSQNSFGALVRSSFTCIVTEGSDRWVLESANVTG
jgi:hypothetical protein